MVGHHQRDYPSPIQIIGELQNNDFVDSINAMCLQLEFKKHRKSGNADKTKVPAQRLVDFINGKTSIDIPKHHIFQVQYLLTKRFISKFIYKNLRQGFIEFGKQIMDI